MLVIDHGTERTQVDLPMCMALVFLLFPLF